MTIYKGETSLATRKQAEELLAELRRQAYAEGYEQAKKDAEKDAEMDDYVNNPPMPAPQFGSPQEERDRIVEQAKADIESLKGRCRGVWYGSIDDLYHISDGSYSGSYALRAKFVINKHKRTVVVLMYGAFSNKVRSRGIAKCAPGDCFNVHIGKAIALRRALGLGVPDEYVYAPQPTEVRVGDVVHNLEWRIEKPYAVRQVVNGKAYDRDGSYAFVEELTILDDSREEEDDAI